MNQKELAVIVPSYNEEKALPNTLKELLTEYGQEQVIVVNDGSTDETSRLARETGVTVIDLPDNMGIGVAMQTGYRYAAGKGFRFALQCDGDGQHNPKDIPLLIEKMEETGADMVIGSRFVDGSAGGFKSFFFRRVAIRYLSTWLKLLTGKTVRDITSGFRLVNRKGLEIFAEVYPFDYPEPESIVLLQNYGCSIVETPVTMRERQGGISSIGILGGVYYLVKVTIGLSIMKLRGTS
jgi:hypothetical protein